MWKESSSYNDSNEHMGVILASSQWAAADVWVHLNNIMLFWTLEVEAKVEAKAEVEFVHTVTAGGSVKFLPAV